MDFGKAFLVFFLFVFLIIGISIIPHSPLAGMIIVFLAIILITLLFEPATGKALLKIFIPVIFLMVILTAIISAYESLSFEAIILIIMVVFLLFIGSASALGSTEMKSSLVLAPLIVIPTFFALLIDRTGRLAIIVSSMVMFGFLALVFYLVRNLGEGYDVTMPERFGVAITDLNPKGKVKVGGEIWWAFSERWNIKKGEEIFVVDRRDLELKVVPAIRCPVCGEKYPIIDVPEHCKNCGAPLSEILYKTIEEKLRKNVRV